MFLSSFQADHYGGFPGFYLSAREACASDLLNMRITVFGPKRIRKLIKQGYTFYSNVSNLEIFDYHLMNQQHFEHKSADGCSFKIDTCGHGCRHQHKQGEEEEQKMEEVVV